MPKMTETELSALLGRERGQAVAYMNGDLADRRRKAMDYYFGEPFGNEIDGRSQVVSTDVADTVEWILPALLKIFTAGDEVVRFEPQGPEDEEAAKQATEYVNFVFNQDNPGFMVLHSMFKDALLQKNGFAKVWTETRTTKRTERSEPLPPDAAAVLADMLETAGAKVEREAQEDGAVVVVATREEKTTRTRVMAVPPEEFLISRNARTTQDATYVAHRVRKTASELIEDGWDRDMVDRLAASDEEETNLEQTTRSKGTGEFEEPDDEHKATRTIWITEAYINVDWDGDGIAERRKITHAGPGAEIKDNEVWDGPAPPFVSVTPVPTPHRFFGQSVADLVMDLQLIKSTVLRQYLDNLYLSNNGRHVISDQVNLDDMLTSRPGGLVRLKQGARPADGHVLPLVTPLVAQHALPALEYLDTVKENRTGVTRYNQGTDANTLNKTLGGIDRIMAASQQRIELIARVFAETGVKDLFRLILWNIKTYSQETRVIRLRNKWVPMSPAEWPADFDTTVNVGLGTGNKDQMLGHLSTLLGVQVEGIKLQGGAQGPLFTLKNVYSTVAKLIENMGLKSPEPFVTDPEPKEGEQPPAQPPAPPDPELVKVQAEIAADQQRMQMEVAKLEAEIALQREKAQAEMALKRDAMMADAAIKREGLAMQARMHENGQGGA